MPKKKDTTKKLAAPPIPTGIASFYKMDGTLALYKGDCREVLSAMPEESVDMVFADPPYFLSGGGITCHAGKMVSVNKGKWDRPGAPEENHAFNKEWLSCCRRVMKPDATIWISGTSHVIFSIGYALQELGFRILNDIVWFKSNAPPNLGCRCFTHSTELVLWASKSKKSKHTFHYKEMRKEAGGKQMRNVWEFRSPAKEEKKFGKHPTQKPLSLLDRIIRASTNKGDVVLDPFNGSGSTGIAAFRLNRRYIGIETEDKFLQVSVKRFKDEDPLFRI